MWLLDMTQALTHGLTVAVILCTRLAPSVTHPGWEADMGPEQLLEEGVSFSSVV